MRYLATIPRHVGAGNMFLFRSLSRSGFGIIYAAGSLCAMNDKPARLTPSGSTVSPGPCNPGISPKPASKSKTSPFQAAPEECEPLGDFARRSRRVAARIEPERVEPDRPQPVADLLALLAPLTISRRR